MKERVLKNTGAYMIAGLAPYVVNFFMLPVYTRFMTPEDYGVLALLNSLASFVLCFAGLQLGTSIGRFFFEYEGAQKRRFLSTILYAVLGAAVLLLVPLHFAGPALTRAVFPSTDITYYPYTFLVLITVFCSAVTTCVNMMLRVEERGVVILWTSLLHTLLGVLFGVYFVVLKGMGAHGALLAGALNGGVFAVTLLVTVRRNLAVVFDTRILRPCLAYALPMIPQALGSILFVYLDKLILGYFVPLAMVGLYSIADRIAMLLRLTVNSFSDAITPNFMRESVADKDAVIRKYRYIITKWGVMISWCYLVLALFTEELVAFMTPLQYHGAYVFIPVLMGAYVFKGLYNFAVSTVMFEKKTLFIPLMSFTAGACNAVLNILLIPRFGTMAAAWTTLVSYGVLFGMAWIVSNRYYPLRYNWRVLFNLFSTALAFFLVTRLLLSDILWLNLLLKTLAVAGYSALLIKWNHGRIMEDVRLLWHMAVRRSARRG